MSLERFPWPFTRDVYKYSANVEPAPRRTETAVGHWGDTVLDVDEHHDTELAERERSLATTPPRYVELPHMRAASWEAALHLLRLAASEWPQHFELAEHGADCAWTNRLLDRRTEFRAGDPAFEPLPFVARHLQEDIALLDQRDGELYLDAGVVTFASNWSLDFDIGMRFLDVHGPVPRDYADGAIPRAREFLLRLEPGAAYRRQNWSSTPSRCLDTAAESFDTWGRYRGRLLDPGSDLGAELAMRVEVQHLIRLPVTRVIVFLIHTYLLPVGEIAAVPAWAVQFASVLEHAPDDMLAYKGYAPVKDRLLQMLRTSTPSQPAG